MTDIYGTTREPGGDREDSRPVNTALSLYRAHHAFWRDLAIVLAVLGMLPFVACLGV